MGTLCGHRAVQALSRGAVGHRDRWHSVGGWHTAGTVSEVRRHATCQHGNTASK